MVDYTGNAIPAAGINRGPHVPDDEILYSAVGYTQKGVTLAPGQGVLKAGTALARRTSDKLYVKFASGGADGAGTAVGILRKTVDTGTSTAEDAQKHLANVVIMGILKLGAISAANGGADAIVTALDATKNEAFGTFKF